MARLVFISVTAADPRIQERLRQLRNRKTVRMQSFTDHVISREEHARWIASLRRSRKKLAMAAMLDGKLVGAVSLNDIDRRAGSADWSFYVDPARQGQGIGRRMLRRFVELAFGEYGLRTLHGNVLDANAGSVKLHARLGFVRVSTWPAKKNGRAVETSQFALSKRRWRQLHV
jgi:UDP-4-amino-4,6-dideoxy-N-acetyl-beta-L-altrosamine N-acetyltransferase